MSKMKWLESTYKKSNHNCPPAFSSAAKNKIITEMTTVTSPNMIIFLRNFCNCSWGICFVIIFSSTSFLIIRTWTAYKTNNTLHDHKVIPVVNENDTTATDEIQFGDNDLLSARLAKLFRADLLIMLSTVDGLHESFLNNGNLSQASLLKSVNKITPTIKKMAGRASQLGKGGMISKIEAAQLILGMNSELVITRGDTPDPITKLRRNSLSTWFKKWKH